MGQIFSIIFALVVGSIILLSLNQVYGQSDFTLEARTIDNSLDVVKFEMQGEKYKDICRSLQCIIDYKDRFTFFFPPTPQGMMMDYQVLFKLQDNVTHADLGQKKKAAMEEYQTMSNCQVDNIIEDNGKEIYTCSGFGTINRNFDHKSWGYNSDVIYDAKNSTLKIFGNFTGKEPTLGDLMK
jgi:hypothetical protein